MNARAIEGLLLILAFLCIVVGAWLNWGAGWGLLSAGILITMRGTAHFLRDVFSRRGMTDG